jgi:hypothetical protein
LICTPVMTVNFTHRRKHHDRHTSIIHIPPFRGFIHGSEAGKR